MAKCISIFLHKFFFWSLKGLASVKAARLKKKIPYFSSFFCVSRHHRRGGNWRPHLKPIVYHSTIVLRGLWRALKRAPITLRYSSLSDSECNFSFSLRGEKYLKKKEKRKEMNLAQNGVVQTSPCNPCKLTHSCSAFWKDILLAIHMGKCSKLLIWSILGENVGKRGNVGKCSILLVMYVGKCSILLEICVS